MGNNFWVELTESPKQFEGIILAAIASKLDNAFGKAYTKIAQETKTLVHQALSKSDVLNELREGRTLRGELGLTSGLARSAAQTITEEVSGSVQVEYKSIELTPKGSKGGLTFYIQPENLSNVLDIAQAQISYYSKRYKRAVKLDWLDWLLMQGDRIIVAKFHYEPSTGRGRSGLGEMKKEGMFRMSSQWSGDQDDNFISRAITTKRFRTDLTELIRVKIGKYL
tara:strand:+ start:111 stop:782 length:672 start_codon:yes stop_codon:yes gene_type:complete